MSERVPTAGGLTVRVGGRDDLVGCTLVTPDDWSVELDIASEEPPAKEEP